MRWLYALPLSLLTAALLVMSVAAAPVEGPEPQGIPDGFVPEPPGIGVTSWIEGLEAPWSLVFLPDGRALVSERPGRIRLIQNGRLAVEPYAAFDTTLGNSGALQFLMKIAVGGEGGLMGLAVHPRFPNPPYVYAMHTYRDGERSLNRVVRLIDEGNRARVDRVVLDGIPGSINHNGGRIGFGPDGMLYVTAGETFHAELAQDKTSLAGKILRITADGGVPADNPFPGSPIYSFGNRNPQGLAWHPQSGQLFASEHGPSSEFGLRARDEINVIVKGGNYGWPLAVGAPRLAGLRDPIAAWNSRTTPPAGMTFWRGDLFVATLRSQALLRLEITPAGAEYRVTRIERWFASEDEGRFGRLRDAVAGPDGALYLLTSNRDGRGRAKEGDDRILRIEAVK